MFHEDIFFPTYTLAGGMKPLLSESIFFFLSSDMTINGCNNALYGIKDTFHLDRMEVEGLFLCNGDIPQK